MRREKSNSSFGSANEAGQLPLVQPVAGDIDFMGFQVSWLLAADMSQS